MIRGQKPLIIRILKEVSMPASTVLEFSEPTKTMTFAEGLAFIERTRRQLDRFDTALPHEEGKAIDPAEAATIRRKLDELEADFRKDLGYI
jgi:hypothetical protein